MGTVVIKKGKSGPLYAGHPWIFSGAIERHEDDGSDLVGVLDDRGQTLGKGLLSQKSSIRVRMLDVEGIEKAEALDTDLLFEHFRSCLARRAPFGFPSPDTDVFRLHNSEGDGIGGLTVDVLGPQLVVVQLTTAPVVRRREAVTDALRRLLPDASVYEVPASDRIAGLEGFAPHSGWLAGAQLPSVNVVENGVRFLVEPQDAQKTGHYADMRPHRAWVASVASGRSVLDAYCYTGAFALYAARAGASRVTAIDSSATAVAMAERNAALNEVALETHVAKADDFLRSSFDRKQAWDVVIIDPPKLAPSRKHVAKAMKVYESLAVQAARVTAPGGYLCVGSCSEAIGLSELQALFGAVTGRLRRSTRVVYSGSQGPDHPYPAAMPEAHYLTFVAAQIS